MWIYEDICFAHNVSFDEKGDAYISVAEMLLMAKWPYQAYTDTNILLRRDQLFNLNIH